MKSETKSVGTVVGKDIPTAAVMSALRSAEAFGLLYDCWGVIAHDLELPEAQIEQMETFLRMDLMNLTDVVGNMIQSWTVLKGDDAKIQVLIRSFLRHGLDSCSEALKTRFNITFGPDSLPTSPVRLKDLDFRPLKLSSLSPTKEKAPTFSDLELELLQGTGDSIAFQFQKHSSNCKDFEKRRKVPLSKSSTLETYLHLASRNPSPEARLKLIPFLIDKGISPFAKDKENRTFIQTYLETSGPSPSEFYKLLEILEERDLLSILNFPGGSNEATQFQLAVKYVELEQRSLTFLVSQGVNFNAHDKFGNSIFYYAIEGRRSPESLEMLAKQFEADWRYLNQYGNSLLHVAAAWGSPEALKFFLNFSRELNINLKNEKEETPLHYATYNRIQDDLDKHRVIKLLIQNGADVMSKDKRGFTFLHYLLWKNAKTPSSSKFHSIIKSIVKSGRSDLGTLFNTSVGRTEATPFHWAVHSLELRPETLHIFKQSKVNFNALDKDGNSILAYAIKGGRNAGFLKSLITVGGADWNHLNKNEENLLHIAAASSAETTSGHLEVIGFILNLSWKSFLNQKNKQGMTPLHLAALKQESGSLWEIIRLLTEAGSDILLKDNEGHDFLELLLLRNPIKPSPLDFHRMTKLVLDKGGDIQNHLVQLAVLHLEPEERTLKLLREVGGLDLNTIEDSDGNSLLVSTIKGKRSVGFVQRFVPEMGENLLAKLNKNREGLLHIAAGKGTPKTLSYLLDLNVLDVNAQTEDKGFTPLHVAALNGDNRFRLKLLEELIKWKEVDVFSKDMEGLTFLHLFLGPGNTNRPSSSEFYSVIRRLIETGNAGLFNSVGGPDLSTPFQLALRYLELDGITLAYLCREVKGLNVNQLDKHGQSGIHYAVMGRKATPQILNDLVRYGASWTSETKSSENILHTAVRSGTTGALKLFLDLGGVDVNQRNETEGNSPLHVGLEALLIMSKVDKYQDKPVLEETVQKCRLLIKNNASLNINNLEGKSPLGLLAEVKRTELGETEILKKLFKLARLQ